MTHEGHTPHLPHDGAESSGGLGLAISILLAITAVAGAVSSCGLSTTFDDAGDADAAGVTSLVNYSDARTRAVLNSLEDYRLYTDYRRNEAVANTIRLQLPDAPASERAALQEDLSDARTNALAFPTSLARYIDASQPGGYDIERQIGESVANGSSNRDFSFEAYFAKADDLRAEGQRMLRVPIVLALSVVLLSVAESSRPRHRIVIAAAGTLLAIAGVAMLVVV
jgi:hypothetical protein